MLSLSGCQTSHALYFWRLDRVTAQRFLALGTWIYSWKSYFYLTVLVFWKTSFSIIESVNWSFSFTSVLCFYLNTFWFFPFQCSEPTSSTISSCTSAGTSCSVRSGSSTFSSTSTLDFSSCGSVDEDWEISGRSSPIFSSTPKEKGQPKEDGCTPPVNVRLLRDYIFLPCPSH